MMKDPAVRKAQLVLDRLNANISPEEVNRIYRRTPEAVRMLVDRAMADPREWSRS